MSFTITHHFDNPLFGYQHSPSLKFANIEWFLEFAIDDESIWLTLAASVDNLIRPGVKWEIIVDFTCKIIDLDTFTSNNNTIYGGENEVGICYVRNNSTKKIIQTLNDISDGVYDSDTSDPFDRGDPDPDVRLMNDQGIDVEIVVRNIRMEGLRKFTLETYENFGLDRDLTILVKEEKILCHSLIVGLNSAVFREMLKNKSHPLEITLDETTSADDVRELLHHLYNTGEEIDEHNVKLLLELGKKYQLTQLLERCQRSLDSQMNRPSAKEDSILENFLLLWKYGLEPLKKSCADNIFENERSNYVDKRRKILRKKLYLEMDDATKLQMWEFLNERLDN